MTRKKKHNDKDIHTSRKGIGTDESQVMIDHGGASKTVPSFAGRWRLGRWCAFMFHPRPGGLPGVPGMWSLKKPKEKIETKKEGNQAKR